ncbi:MAG TPA: hypothetical protein DF613_02665 [Lachnospiraceae bacterium]|nr:hypothetical protein [Lachnospiraceae bacterium]
MKEEKMYRYIVIDDETLTRKDTIEKLASLHTRVQCIGEAGNGSKGLYLIERLHPDIVITDMKMLVMGDLQLLPLLTERYPELFIIVISGYHDFDYMREAVRAGAVDYVLKPFGIPDICAVMTRTLGRLASHELQVQEELIVRDTCEQAQFARDKEALYGLLEGYTPGASDPGSRRIKLLYQNRSLVLATLHSDSDFSEEAVNRFLADNGYEDPCSTCSTPIFRPWAISCCLCLRKTSSPPKPTAVKSSAAFPPCSGICARRSSTVSAPPTVP